MPVDLGSWLATAETALAANGGTLTLVVDSDDAGGFISQLGAGNRITVASAGNGQTAHFFQSGTISFSRFFWGQTLNGATVRQAFRNAQQALSFGPFPQVPELDDNGNGIPNELLDGLLAARYSIGSGVLLAGDDPVIGSISDSAPIRQTNYSVFVDGVTSTGQIARVSAVVFHPSGATDTVTLTNSGSDRYGAILTGLDETNTVDTQIAVFAEDLDGNVSLPAGTLATGDILFRNGFD